MFPVADRRACPHLIVGSVVLSILNYPDAIFVFNWLVILIQDLGMVDFGTAPTAAIALLSALLVWGIRLII